jgi:putative drug exporter of the RND superfamily
VQSAERPGLGRVLDRYASLVTRRRAKWVILVAWIVLLAAVSPLAAKLGDVIDNDAVTFLPEGTESVQVAQVRDDFENGDSVTAVVVYQRDDGLTENDFAIIETDRQAIAEVFPGVPVTEPIPSEDGLAAIYNVILPDRGDPTLEDIELLRETVSEDSGGLQIKVTGPAGFLVDLVDVFEGIDTTLLIASAIVVTILLLITYRSPFLWFFPLLTVAFAFQVANAGAYGLVEIFGVTINGQTQGILPILVFGAGTDYALLLIARYREELRRQEREHDAMRAALRSGSPAILASSGTVVIGLLCLLLAQLNTNQSLGPVGAGGILSALLAMLTLLPAFLLIVGRRVFWPFIPHYGSEASQRVSLWGRVGAWISNRPRPVWIGTAIVLGITILGVIGVDTTLNQAEQFRSQPDALVGQELISASFPAGSGQPNTVIANAEQAEEVQSTLAGLDGVVDVAPGGVSEDGSLARFFVTFDAEPASRQAFDAIDQVRVALGGIEGANALVGGPDAESLDVQNAVIRDATLIIPLIFLVTLVILVALLQSVAAPVMLILTNILSNGAALGVSIVAFDRIFGFGGTDPTVILLGFVFLVALGIDYNIFLMSRAHEEAKTLGTRAGMLKALSVTGSVITSAGVVLAATFAVLGVLPLVVLTELGFLVAVGVLIDTLIVRSILVPALTFDFGSTVWWPSNLWKRERGQATEPSPAVIAERAFQGLDR